MNLNNDKRIVASQNNIIRGERWAGILEIKNASS